MPTPAERKTTAVRAKLLEVALALPEEGFTVPQVQSKWFDMFGSATMITPRRVPPFLKQMGYSTTAKTERHRKVFKPSVSRQKREKMLFDIFDTLGWNMKIENYKE